MPKGQGPQSAPGMPKPLAASADSGLITIQCPCCDAVLVIDPAIPAVIRHQEADKPKTFSDFEAAAARQQTEAERREELFRKSVSETKNRESVLGKKFEELLKQAKTDPDEAPPKRPFDFD
ncbi:MAG: hypothetical protein ABI823_20905 [Bryobacteraceae bacterium]